MAVHAPALYQQTAKDHEQFKSTNEAHENMERNIPVIGLLFNGMWPDRQSRTSNINTYEYQHN